MRLLLLVRCVVGLVVVVAGPAAAGGTGAAPGSGMVEYAVEARLGERPVEKDAMRIWFRGREFRLEVSRPQGKDVTIGGPGGVFTLYAENREWMKRVRPPSGGGIPGVPFSDLAKLRQQKSLGAETVGRYRAEIYEDRSSPGAQMKARVWVSRDVPVPVQVVEQGTDRRVVRVLKSARFGAPVPDGLLRLPPGVRRAPSVKSGYVEYEVRTTLRGQPFSTASRKVWFKGERYRREQVTQREGGGGRQLTVGTADGALTVAPGRTAPTRVAPRAHFVDEIPGVPFTSRNIRATWKRAGTEKVGRATAEIYEPRRPSSRRSVRVWLARDLPVPVKIVTTRRSGPGTHPPSVIVQTTVLRSARMGIEVADGLLQLPRTAKR